MRTRRSAAPVPEWRRFVAWPVDRRRSALELWRYRMFVGTVALVPASPDSPAVFAEVVRDATKRHLPCAHGCCSTDPELDEPAFLARVFVGGTDRAVETLVLPNGLVLRYCSLEQAMSTTKIPREWLDDGSPAIRRVSLPRVKTQLSLFRV